MSEQEDPIIMYLIVRDSLNMSIGKTAAQCAHASQMLQLKYHELINFDIAGMLEATGKESYLFFDKWMNNSYRKVVLKADEKEWVKLKEAMDENDVIVVDAGLTELEPNTETVIGLWPMYKSKAGKLIKRLQILK